MAISSLLQEGILRLAEQAATEQGLEGEAREQALVTLIEEIAVEVGDALAREIMKRKLAAQAACENPVCPTCGSKASPKAERKRSILTRRGEVEFAEPECYCKRCRRSFFPSVPSARAGCDV